MNVNVTTLTMGSKDLDVELYMVMRSKAMQLGGQDNEKENVHTHLVSGPDVGKKCMHSEFTFPKKAQAIQFVNWLVDENTKLFAVTICRHSLSASATAS